MYVSQKSYLKLCRQAETWEEKLKQATGSMQTPAKVAKSFQLLKEDLEKSLDKHNPLSFKEGKREIIVAQRLDSKKIEQLFQRAVKFQTEIQARTEEPTEGIKLFNREVNRLIEELSRAAAIAKQHEKIFKDPKQVKKELAKCQVHYQKSNRYFNYGMSSLMVSVIGFTALIVGLSFIPLGLITLILSLLLLGASIYFFIRMNQHHTKALQIENSKIID